MSEPNDAPPPQPPDDLPPSSPFPESSLTPPPLPPQEEPPAESPPPPPQEEPPAESPPPPPPVASPDQPAVAPPTPPPVAFPEPPAVAAPPPAQPTPEPRPWMQPEPREMPPPPAGGLVAGDPLAGSQPAPSSFPPGYTSPAPPGAGGFAAPPAQSGFGAAAPAAGRLVLAGWWRRVGAAVIDGLIISIVAFIIMTPLGIGLFASDGDSDGGFVALILGFIVAGLIVAVVAFAYAPVMMGKTNGKTLGRMATGIRVVRADGKPITIGFAALREVAVKTLLIGTVAGSLTFGLAALIDVLWPLWDDENRALHDFVVNTRTVMDQ